jgi:FixJ family two-component response regulator
MTGRENVPIADQPLQAGAVDVIEKPFTNTVILASVRRALSIGLSANSSPQAQEAMAGEASVNLELVRRWVCG